MVGHLSFVSFGCFCVLNPCKYLWENWTQGTWVQTWKGGCPWSSLCVQVMLNAHLGQVLSYDLPRRVVASTCQAPSLQQNRSKLIKIINEVGTGKKAVASGEGKGTGRRRGRSLSIPRTRFPILSCTLWVKEPCLHSLCSSWVYGRCWRPEERKRRVMRLTRTMGQVGFALPCSCPWEEGMQHPWLSAWWLHGMGWALWRFGRNRQILPVYVAKLHTTNVSVSPEKQIWLQLCL